MRQCIMEMYLLGLLEHFLAYNINSIEILYKKKLKKVGQIYQ